MKRRFISTLLAFCMMLALLPGTALAAVAATGKCGDYATWSLSDDGTMTISGMGNMDDYLYNSRVPWYNRRFMIKRVIIKEGITSVGKYAFYDCDNLTGVTIPEGVTAISSYAFQDCENLTSLSLPVSLSTIGTHAFKNTARLWDFYYAGTINQWSAVNVNLTNNSALYGLQARMHFAGNPTITAAGICGPTAIWTIDENNTLTINGTGNMDNYSYSSYVPWYNRRSTIKRVIIEEGITSIGKYIFYDCDNLTSVTIPEGVITISSYAFQNSDNLTSLSFPASLGTINAEAFRNTARLFTFYYAGSPEQWAALNVHFSNDKKLYHKNAKFYYNSTGPAQNYTVTFNANGGSVSDSKEEYKANAALGTLPTPTRSGYRFNGWYTKPSGGTKVTSSTKVTANTTLYAHWTKNTTTATTYTITLNANGGSVSPASLKVSSGQTYYSSLPVPARTGWKFAGWYTTKTGSTKITSATKATANRTIYAHWTRSRTYMVTFDPNGGDVYQDMKLVVSTGTYRELPTPVRNGYHFKGWYTRKTGGVKVTESSRVSLSGSQTLYAQWQTAASAKSTKTGSWRVTVPAYWEFPLYSTAASARSSGTAPEKASYQTIFCTRKATLSNDTVRYYGKVNNRNMWFTYSCEMDVQ